MHQRMAAPLATGKRRMLAARLPQGETACQVLAVESMRAVGALIDRALVLAGLTKQQASFAMGYRDETASVVSKWTQGTERPQLDRLLSVPALRRGLILAIAESSGSDVEIRTVVTVPHLKAVGQ